MGFVIGEYRAVEVLEPAAPAVGVQSYRGEDSRSGDAVVLTVLGDDHLDAVQSALRALPDVQHPHLLQVREMVQDEARCAVICRWPAGGRLAELLARRHRLTVPETLTVLIPLAAALAALHAAQVRHGDVGPSTIWFDAAGRPLLGAVGVAHVAATVGGGLPGGISDVAPEVVRGERRTGGAVTPAADVFSLGSVALRCLAGRPAWPADDPADVLVQSAAGLWPDLPDDAGPPRLVAVVREMLRAEPARRPTAMEVVSVLEGVGIPEPVAFGPVPATAATSRWSGWGASQLHAGGPVGRERSAVGGAKGGAVDPPAAGTPRTPRRDSPGTTGPLPAAAGPSRLARAGIAVLVGLLAVVIAVQIGLWWTGRDQPGAAPGQAVASNPAGEETDDEWLQVVTALDAARGRALETVDAAVLAQVYLPQSAPALADTRTIEDLAERGWAIRDGVHRITSVTLAPAGSAPADAAAGSLATDQPVRLLVVGSLPARPIVDGAGNEVGQTAARGEQRRILSLVPTLQGYRISAVEPG
jgi:hypothetical protein